MYGLSKKEINGLMPQIIEFAELESVIDDPVKTYSSGMYMRLGFSLAIHTDPDVLLVDEVLAVGDAAFVSKCKDRIEKLRAAQKTLLLVTHDLAAVERWCDEVIWIEKGSIYERGDPRRVVDAYLQELEKEQDRQSLIDHQPNQNSPTDIDETPQQGTEQRWGSREVEISSVILSTTPDSDSSFIFDSGDPLKIVVSYLVNEAVTDLVFGIGVRRLDGLTVFGTNTDIEKIEVPDQVSHSGVLTIDLNSLDLVEGNYLLDIAAHRADGYPYDYRQGVLDFKVRSRLARAGCFYSKASMEFSKR